MALLASVGRGPEPAVLRRGGFPSLVLPASCLVCVSWGLCMGECACVRVCVYIHQRAPASVELCVLGTLVVVHLCASLCVHLCVCVYIATRKVFRDPSGGTSCTFVLLPACVH